MFPRLLLYLSISISICLVGCTSKSVKFKDGKTYDLTKESEDTLKNSGDAKATNESMEKNIKKVNPSIKTTIVIGDKEM